MNGLQQGFRLVRIRRAAGPQQANLVAEQIKVKSLSVNRVLD
jgi:hypothetical protein